jgi:hypothetical protein
MKKFTDIREEVPSNNAGSASNTSVAGLGSEPPVSKAAQKKKKKTAEIARRKSAEMDEAKGPALTFEFPDERKAKQFDLDIENSSIGIGNRTGNQVKVTGVETKWRAAVKKAMKKNRGKLVTESVELGEARKDVFVIVDKKGKVVAANLTKDNAHKEISRHRGGTIVLDPDAKVGNVLKKFAKESVEVLDEKRLPYHHEPDARMRKGIESGKFPMVASKKSILGGDTLFGVFQFTGKAAGGGKEPGTTSDKGMKYTVDGYVMAIIDKKKKVLAYYGSHPNPDGAINKFGRNHGLIGESVELDESQRFGGKTNIPASKETTKYIESGKGIILDVPSSLHPTSRFAIYKNPAKGSGQDKVLMATISNPKRGRIKMFSFHGTHVSHQKAMDFAKKHKLVAKTDAKGNPLYAKESVEVLEHATLHAEGKMKELHMHIQDGKTAEQIAKIMRLDVKTIKALMKGHKESVELDESTGTFAGCKVFKVSSEEYGNCVQTPRKKNERWKKKLNMEMHGDIRQYAHRNPGRPVIVQDENSGAMSYLIIKPQGD